VAKERTANRSALFGRLGHEADNSKKSERGRVRARALGRRHGTRCDIRTEWAVSVSAVTELLN